MGCWGELKSLRTEVSAYWSCVQFSGYVEMKVSQAYNKSKAGYAPALHIISHFNLITFS